MKIFGIVIDDGFLTTASIVFPIVAGLSAGLFALWKLASAKFETERTRITELNVERYFVARSSFFDRQQGFHHKLLVGYFEKQDPSDVSDRLAEMTEDAIETFQRPYGLWLPQEVNRTLNDLVAKHFTYITHKIPDGYLENEELAKTWLADNDNLERALELPLLLDKYLGAALSFFDSLEAVRK